MTPSETVPVGTVVTTDVPTRLDRLRWSQWHRRVVIALGVTWILDGLEASLIANLGPVLSEIGTLHLTESEIGNANSIYLIGQVLGALFFGYLTDKLGRKKLFLVTLSIYLIATFLSGISPNFIVFAFFRFLAGTGIGGEYAAINSAIDELIPARVRGHVDLAINGSYWVGVALGALLTMVLLNPAYVPHSIGWRVTFGLGSLLGLVILFVRRHVPESPRWLLMHGYIQEADKVVREIEQAVAHNEPLRLATSPAPKVRIKITGSVGFGYIARTLLQKHRRRSVFGLVLMTAQAFFYDGIFFTYGLILSRFYGIASDRIGLSMIPFAAGNFLGPLLLGRLFDTIGRRVMITATYGISGLLLIGTGYAFHQGWLNATTQTICWCVVFFFASSAASSAYLTVSELFPVELRGMAIALFYALATCVGAFAPSIFGAIVQSGSRTALFEGYIFASVLMIAAACVAAVLGVAAEGKSLEELSGAAEPVETTHPQGRS